MIPALLSIAAALALGVLFVAERPSLRAPALGAIALATGGLALWLPSTGDPIRRHLLIVAVALVVGLPLSVVVARVFRRAPLAFFASVAVAIPLRLALTHDGREGTFLLLLYAVVACAFVGLVLDVMDGFPTPQLGPWIGLPLAGYVGLAGLSLTWSGDVENGVTSMLFYLLPFGVLVVAIAAYELRDLGPLLRIQVALALVLTGVGVYQSLTHTIWWNHKLMTSNEFAGFFRVNSLFYDPSIFGRFLAVTIALIVSALFFVRVRSPKAAAAAAIACWIGLFVSYSQSSFVALSAGLAIALVIVGGRRFALALAVVATCIALVTLALPGVRSASLDRVTSGRSQLAGKGLDLYLAHPFAGVGFGASEKQGGRRVQHVLPLTVASELGTLGLLVLAWLLAALARLAFLEGARRPERLVLGVGLAVVIVHALFYAAFFEDPLSFALIALLASSARPGMIVNR